MRLKAECKHGKNKNAEIGRKPAAKWRPRPESWNQDSTRASSRNGAQFSESFAEAKLFSLPGQTTNKLLKMHAIFVEKGANSHAFN